MSLAKPEELILPAQDAEMREEQPSEVRNPEAIEEQYSDRLTEQQIEALRSLQSKVDEGS